MLTPAPHSPSSLQLHPLRVPHELLPLPLTLQLLNERLFDNGNQRLPCPLLTLVGASNELPESEELDALYDRFLIRRTVAQVGVWRGGRGRTVAQVDVYVGRGGGGQDYQQVLSV